MNMALTPPARTTGTPTCSWSLEVDTLGMGFSACSLNCAALAKHMWRISPGEERINVYFNEATGGRYVPRAVLMDLEPGSEAAFCGQQGSRVRHHM